MIPNTEVEGQAYRVVELYLCLRIDLAIAVLLKNGNLRLTGCMAKRSKEGFNILAKTKSQISSQRVCYIRLSARSMIAICFSRTVDFVNSPPYCAYRGIRLKQPIRFTDQARYHGNPRPHLRTIARIQSKQCDSTCKPGTLETSPNALVRISFPQSHQPTSGERDKYSRNRCFYLLASCLRNQIVV